MIHFNVELWKIHQLFVLQVLYKKEIIPTRKAYKLAKAEFYDAPKPGGPLTTRQPAENLYVLYHETHT